MLIVLCLMFGSGGGRYVTCFFICLIVVLFPSGWFVFVVTWLFCCAVVDDSLFQYGQHESNRNTLVMLMTNTIVLNVMPIYILPIACCSRIVLGRIYKTDLHVGGSKSFYCQ